MNAMVYCSGCGSQMHETARACPQCGAPAKTAKAADATIPDGIRGWSWGAFLLNWIWSIGNSVWIGLLCLVPYVNIVMMFVLGFKGREWAWKAKKWDSVEHFNRVQKSWTKWGVIIAIVGFVIGVISAIAIPAILAYSMRGN